jgi:hypothetical protein
MRARLVAILVALAGIASCTTGPLRPDHWLVWRVEELRSDQSADGLSWTYYLVLENRGRQAVKILRGFASVRFGTVHSSPDEVVTNRTIAAGETVRLPHTAVFQNSPGPELDLVTQKAVKWQFWGNYEDGEGVVLNAEVIQ